MSRSIARHQPVVSAPENPAALYDLLRHLGVTANYVGFSHIGDAVQLCMHSPQRLQLVTKQVYQEVAQRRGTTWKAVERNIRRMVGGLAPVRVYPGEDEMEALAMSGLRVLRGEPAKVY